MAARVAEQFQKMAALFPELRQQLGEGQSESLLAALRTAPRHLFTPGVALAGAYEDAAIVTKTGESGVALSSVSAPSAHRGHARPA